VRQRTEETPAGAYHFIRQRVAELHDNVCQSPVVVVQAKIGPAAIEIRVLRDRLDDGGFVIGYDNSQ
jgi:hypothetical protein